MNLEKRQALFDQAQKWVLEAGDNIRKRINEPIKIDTKSNDNDLVTEVDKETEIFFARRIKQTYPNHLLLGEEGYGDNVTTLDGTVWIIDPIDGTTNFVHLKKQFAISVGIFHNGIGEIGFIYDVMADVLYSAKQGEGGFKNGEQLKQLNPEVQLRNTILSFDHDLLSEKNQFNEKVIKELLNDIRGSRLIGAAALELAYIAEGGFDGYFCESLAPWDVAAGMIIVTEVGGTITRSNGDKINMLEKGEIVACNKGLFDTLINNYFKKWKKE